MKTELGTTAAHLLIGVEGDEELEVLDVKVLVGCKRTKVVTTIAGEDIKKVKLPRDRGQITGDEDLQPLYHLSRVVGYYSRQENWNKSKQGEAKDRRKGNYALPSGK